MISKFTIFVIKLYQKTLSPDHGPLRNHYTWIGCRFHPTCSDYAIQAIEKKGFLRAVPLVLWRLLRCNPFSDGGCDPVK